MPKNQKGNPQNFICPKSQKEKQQTLGKKFINIIFLTNLQILYALKLKVQPTFSYSIPTNQSNPKIKMF
jgi:hypothetical protein